MALPPGVTTCVVTFGSPASGFGGEDVSTALTITPSHSVYHAATGAPLLAFEIRGEAGEGLPGSVTLPHTDQAGFLDASGNAFTNWAYTATGQWRSGGSTINFKKNFQLPTGQSVIDLDLIPNGTIDLPVTAPTATVTSFLGKTGSIEEEDLADLELGGGVADGGVTRAKLAEDVRDELDTAKTALEGRLSEQSLAEHYVPTPGSTGTAGQVLSKTSEGTAWVAPPSGGSAAGAINRTVLIGPSLEEQIAQGAQTLDATGGAAMRARGWFHWANAFLFNALYLIYNAGVGGNRYDQMLARFDTDVIAYNPKFVVIGCPTNDLGAGRTTAQTIADLTAMIAKCQAIGATVIVLTIPPRDSFNSAAKRTYVAVMNQYISDLSTQYQNVMGVDFWRPIADPTTGFPAAGTTVDGTHYSVAGAAILGARFATAIRHLITVRPPQFSYASDPRRIVTNPSFLSTGSGWTALSGATVTYEKESGGYGNKAKIAIASNTSLTALRGITNTSVLADGLWAVGDIFQVTARLKWSNLVALAGDTPGCPVIRVEQLNSGGTVVRSASALYTASTEWPTWPSGHGQALPFPTSGEGVFSTWRSTVHADAASIRVSIGWIGVASVDTEVSELAPIKDAASTVAHPSPSPNIPPVASFTATPTGLTVAFNASGSTDVDGSIASYAWTFGDGTNATGITPSRTYAAAGTYTVTLTVTDNQGATHSTSTSVTVVAAPPARASLGVSGYSGRWVAEELGSDGSAVASWPDYEHSGATLTQATTAAQPSVALVNGKKVVHFDGVDDVLANTALPAAWKSIAMLIRINPGSAEAVRYGLVGDNPSPRFGVERTATNRVGVFWTGNRSATGTSGLLWVIGNWYVVVIRNTDGDARAEFGGTAIVSTTAAAGGLDSSTNLEVGRRSPYLAPMEVAELIVWPTQLADADMTTLRTNLLANHATLIGA